MNRNMPQDLTQEELLRYGRHLMLPEVGMQGQLKLKGSRVLMVGAGGLGSPAAMYLAAAGVGHLGIIDFDRVDASNLQRQIMHGTSDIGRPKTASAAARVKEINPNVSVESYEMRLTRENALEIIRMYDIVVDGTDNFATRYLINDACVILGKPNVYGSVFKFEGQASVFAARDGACYRCLYPEPPAAGLVPSCAEGGVLGVLPGIIGSIQANEAIKLLLGKGEPLINRLLVFDAWTMRFRELAFRKNPSCPVCGSHPVITQLIDYEDFCGAMPAGRKRAGEITAEQLRQLLDRGEDFQLIDVREPHEFLIARIPQARHIPLGEITEHLSEIDPARTTVVLCRSGTRSAAAIKKMSEAGFQGELLNLRGGILAWADDVDPTMRKY